MKITSNFIREEFDCRDGTKYPKEWINVRLKPLCEQLEIIRNSVGVPLYILSGYRTPDHNLKVGGKKNSKHIQGIAADIICKGVSGTKLGDIIKRLIEAGNLSDGGLGIYKNFVHYDLRATPFRWVG